MTKQLKPSTDLDMEIFIQQLYFLDQEIPERRSIGENDDESIVISDINHDIEIGNSTSDNEIDYTNVTEENDTITKDDKKEKTFRDREENKSKSQDSER